jgi:hypothetical protein
MSTIDTLCSVCVTRQHEFVIYGSSCIAVRERATGEWLDDHHAVDERIALVPTAYRADRLGPWDLEIHSFGFLIHVGPVVAVIKPDESTRARLEQLVHFGPSPLRLQALGLGASEPG